MTQNNLGVALGALGERERKLLTQGIKTEVADFISRARVAFGRVLRSGTTDGFDTLYQAVPVERSRRAIC
jgi:hypothetical protein